MDISSSLQKEYIFRLNKSLRFIELSYSEDILINDIAAASDFSMYHFHRIFSSIIGESPGEYLRRFRLEKAAAMLYIKPEASITEIALQTGHSSSSVFARSFQKRFGTSAREYRKKSHFIPAPINTLEQKDFSNESDIIPIEIRKEFNMRIAYVRSGKGYGPSIQTVWSDLLSWAYSNDIITEESRLFGIPLDDPEITSPAKCRYFAGITLSDNQEISGPVELMEIPDINFALFTFSGPVDKISAFYKKVYGSWLPRSSYFPDDVPVLEEYSIKYTQPRRISDPISLTLFMPLQSEK